MNAIDPRRYVVTRDTEVGPDIDLDTEVAHDPAGNRITEADAEQYTEAFSAVHERQHADPLHELIRDCLDISAEAL